MSERIIDGERMWFVTDPEGNEHGPYFTAERALRAKNAICYRWLIAAHSKEN